MRLGSTAMTESTGMGARARLFLIAFATIAIAAIGHPSVGAGAIYPGEMATAATPLEEPAVEAEATATEEPVAEPVPVETESAATEGPVAEPVPVETVSAASEGPAA